MKKTLFMLLVFISLLSSASGCSQEPPATEPAAPELIAESTVSPSLPIIGGGGGSAVTIAPSDPQKSFEDAVLNAELIVSGNITDKRYELVPYETKSISGADNTTQQDYGVTAGNITQGKAYTIFTLAVKKVIKGDLATKQIFVKVPGGYIGEVYQVPTGDYFQISDHVLVMLHREDDNIFTISRLAWLRGSVIISEPELNDVIVRVIQVMRANNVPVALPEAEWPPLIEIAPPAQRPERETIPGPEQDKKSP